MKKLINRLFTNTARLQFIADADGLHQLGGEFPEGFTLPENDFKAGFQYLGYINNSDIYFNWLPFKLHLIAPTFIDFDYLALDYSDPNKPRLIHPLSNEGIYCAYNEVDANSRISYEVLRCSVQPFKGITENNEYNVIAMAGKPHELSPENYPELNNGKKMKFVCQLFSNGHVKTKSKNFTGEDSNAEAIFSTMNFRIDGDIKVFIDLESKLVCYTVENT